MNIRLMKYVHFLIAMIIVFGARSQTTVMRIHQNNSTVLQIPINTIDSITYVSTNLGNLASLSTSSVTNVGTTSAVCGGTISNNGGTTITQKGICWSNNVNPTTANNKLVDDSTGSSFSFSLTNLAPGRTYYVRAFAINSAGTAYGNQVSFVTVSNSLATLTTLDVTNITSNSARSGGSIVNSGGSTITQRGICWSTSNNPTTANSKAVFDSSFNSFSLALSNLNPSTTYYVRSFAVNSAGTAYGNQVSFTTLANTNNGSQFNTSLTYGSVSDIDGNTYKTIQIGAQTWMAENLRVTKYRNGSSISIVLDSTQWRSRTTGAWSYYNNDTAKNIPYGKLYNWYAVVDTGRICPSGWHVPTDAEWNTLVGKLDSAYSPTNALQSTSAGSRMKSTGTLYWTGSNQGATNSAGFSAVESRNRSSNGPFGGDGNAYWWSATETSTSNAIFRNVMTDNGSVNRGDDNKKMGFAVRCIKD